MNNYWGQPVSFFEYDPVSNSISAAATPTNNGNIIYMSRMMLLPSKLFEWRKDIQCYTPNGKPHDAWRPTIHAIVPLGGSHYRAEGHTAERIVPGKYLR